MKRAYPVILTPTPDSVLVYLPDFNSGTEGSSVADALDMAADAIGALGITMEDNGQGLPDPTPIDKVKADSGADIVSLVSVDFSE